MATKSPKKTSNKSAKDTKVESVSKQDIILVALELATVLGWESVTLRDVAERAGVSLAVLHENFDDKTDILVAFGRMVDARVLESFGQSGHDVSGLMEESPRDRLFDVLMERFDVLNDYRGGVVSVLRSFRFDPKQAVISCPHLCRSMNWMLEVSGIDIMGVKGAVKVVGLTALYIKVLRVWSKDDTPDLSKTMAALDKHLGQVERFAGRFGL